MFRSDMVPAGTWAGVGFIVASCAGFSFQGTLTRFAYRASATPLMVGLGRFSVAAIVLYGYLLLAHRPALNIPLRTVIVLLALGGVGYFLMSLTYLVAVMYIPVALASFIGYLYPMLATGIAVTIGRDQLTRGLGLGLVITLLGLAVMLSVPAITTHSGPAWWGVACMIANAIAVATYVIISDHVLLQVHSVTAMAYIAIGAALSNAIAGLVTHTVRLNVGWEPWLWIAVIGLVSTVLASSTQLAGLRRLGPTRTATLSTLEALFTLVVAWLILRERLRPLQIAGGMVLLLGAITVIQARRPAVIPPRLDEHSTRQGMKTASHPRIGTGGDDG